MKLYIPNDKNDKATKPNININKPPRDVVYVSFA